MTVREAKPQLGKLVAKVQRGAPVILANGKKLAKLERYVPNGGPVNFDIEKDSPELEAMLLEAVTGPHTPYSRRDLELAAARVRRRLKKR